MLKTLYLVRHAKSIANDKRIYNSDINLDNGLSKAGLKQAEHIGEYFRNTPIDVLFSSPFKRAMQTAEQIINATKTKIKIEEAFKEVNVGDWAELDELTIKKKYPKQWALWKADPFNYPIPNGESVQDVYDRINPAFDRISNEYKNKRVLIVTHYFVFNTLLCSLMGDLKQVRFFDTSNGTIAKINFENRARLEEFVRIE